LICSGSRDGFVRLWDPRRPDTAVASIGPEEGTTNQDCWSVALGKQTSAEQRVIASGYNNGDMKLIDIRMMKTLWETNVRHGICSLEFDAEDPMTGILVATTCNSKIHIVQSGNPSQTHPVESGHKSAVWCASHLPQNRAIFMTSGGDGNLNLWQHKDTTTTMTTTTKTTTNSPKVELLASAGLSKEAISRFSWHPDKTGLGLATSFDQILRIVIVTRLATLTGAS